MLLLDGRRARTCTANIPKVLLTMKDRSCDVPGTPVYGEGAHWAFCWVAATPPTTAKAAPAAKSLDALNEAAEARAVVCTAALLTTGAALRLAAATRLSI